MITKNLFFDGKSLRTSRQSPFFQPAWLVLFAGENPRKRGFHIHWALDGTRCQSFPVDGTDVPEAYRKVSRAALKSTDGNHTR